ncbi:hypothetical protein GCM10017322_24350 [Paracoccus aerius]|nr:hypothetical protein GCM10017322_24350 [Paracoccus aerius]
MTVAVDAVERRSHFVVDIRTIEAERQPGKGTSVALPAQQLPEVGRSEPFMIRRRGVSNTWQGGGMMLSERRVKGFAKSDRQAYGTDQRVGTRSG